MPINFRALPEFDSHELVFSGIDEKAGLVSFIALHNTHLGPAVGGTRLWRYPSEEDALRDALRLSRAMTYKCALANVPYGGGKGVILKTSDDTAPLVRAYADQLSQLPQPFFTGEDVGIGEEEVKIMMARTSRIIGKPGVGGDPSPWASLGVFHAMRAALKEMFGSADFSGRTIAIKGLGKVGLELARLIAREGGIIIGTDTNPKAMEHVKKVIPAIKIDNPETIHAVAADVFSPCALGGDLNDVRIGEIRAKIVCGGANNQLASREMGTRLHERGIVYVPDYVANAGGLINVVDELAPDGYSEPRVRGKVEEIENTTEKIIVLSNKNSKPMNAVADELAESIFKVPAHV